MPTTRNTAISSFAIIVAFSTQVSLIAAATDASPEAAINAKFERYQAMLLGDSVSVQPAAESRRSENAGTPAMAASGSGQVKIHRAGFRPGTDKAPVKTTGPSAASDNVGDGKNAFRVASIPLQQPFESPEPTSETRPIGFSSKQNPEPHVPPIPSVEALMKSRLNGMQAYGVTYGTTTSMSGAPVIMEGEVIEGSILQGSTFANAPQGYPAASTTGTPVATRGVMSSGMTTSVMDTETPLVANMPTVMSDEFAYQPPRLFEHPAYTYAGKDGWPCSTCGNNSCNCKDITWQVQSDVLFLHRSRPGGEGAIYRRLSDGFEIQPGGLSMDTIVGPMISVSRINHRDGRAITARWMSIDSWTSTAQLSGDLLAPAAIPVGVGTGGVRYESKFQNLEVEASRMIGNWTEFIVGFRWIQFDEFAELFGGATFVPNISERVESLNNLYGGQVGIRQSIWDEGGFFTLHGTVKAGMFSNRAEHVTTFGGSFEAQKTSFAGDIALEANYEVTSRWSVNLAYRAMWITDIVESAAYLVPLDPEENVILHGLNVGASWRW